MSVEDTTDARAEYDWTMKAAVMSPDYQRGYDTGRKNGYSEAMKFLSENMTKLLNPTYVLPVKPPPRLKQRVYCFFAWYDLWIGAYWDKTWRMLYICLVPCVVIRLSFRKDGDEG